MKIPILLTSTKGKPEEELREEFTKAAEKFLKAKEKAESKLNQKSSQKKK